MDTRLHQFLSVTFSPAYADEAKRRLEEARRQARTEKGPRRRIQLRGALRPPRRPAREG